MAIQIGVLGQFGQDPKLVELLSSQVHKCTLLYFHVLGTELILSELKIVREITRPLGGLDCRSPEQCAFGPVKLELSRVIQDSFKFVEGYATCTEVLQLNLKSVILSGLLCE